MWDDPWLRITNPRLWRQRQEDREREQREREQREREQREREQSLRNLQQREQQRYQQEQSLRNLQQREQQRYQQEQSLRNLQQREQQRYQQERLAAAADEKRKAEEEAKRIAEEAEAKRITAEAEAKRIAAEAEAKRIAAEAEAKRIAEEIQRARDNVPCTYGDNSTAQWDSYCSADINNCKFGDATTAGIQKGRSRPLNFKCQGLNSVNDAIKIIERTCEKPCPCQYRNHMIPKEGAECSRACYDGKDGGFIDSIYQLVNGPSTCAEKNGKKACNRTLCPDPCLAAGTCPKVEGFSGFSLDGKSAAIKNSGAPITDKVMSYEANLLEALYLFNNEYTYYVSKCTNKQDNFVPDTINNPTADCKSYLDNLNIDKQKIIDYTSNDNAIIGQGLNSSVNYKSNNIILSDNYSKLINMRTDLDEKLRELYDVPGSKSLDYRYNLDSTVYSGILVTIVATAVIYYTFTRL
jgi:hypothetical protein